MTNKLRELLLSPVFHIYFNLFLLLGSIIGWPITALTIFKNEPQGILGLSWLAIIIGAISTLLTAMVEYRQDEK